MTAGLSLKRDLDCLQTIVKYCNDIEHLIHTHGSDEEDFNDNISLQYSCVFVLIQIGEHVKRISAGIKDKYSDVEWKYASGMRDFVVHNYANVNVSRIRTTVLEELPPFKEKCIFIIDELTD